MKRKNIPTPQNLKIFSLGLGLEEWENPNDPIGHRDAVLHSFFKNQGVPDSQNLLIRNEKGSNAEIHQFLPAFLADSDENSFFIFYYAGHGGYLKRGDLKFCHPTEESFTFWELTQIIEENFKGQYVFFLADCCNSGNMVRYCERYEGKYCLASLTSSTYNNTSTNAWTFTDSLLDMFFGKKIFPNQKENLVNLKQLTKHAKEEMLEKHNQKIDFGHSNNFKANFYLPTAEKK